jgi:DNA-binding NtrC family response regulator
MSEIRKLVDVERELILAAVAQLGAVPAAEALGIGKTTLYRRLQEYGLEKVNGQFQLRRDT